jgi:pSer/pThr/pTyr-binding forkhead associated (FHA) protein
MMAVAEDTGLPPHVLTPWAEQAHLDAVEALPAEAALLVVQRGPMAGTRFILDRPVITVGRQSDNDIVLDDVTVSRRHAGFHRGDGGFCVRDVGSLNGTYVNRQPVHEATLASGDQVQIGKFGLLYLAGADVDAGTQADQDRTSRGPARR